MKIRIAGAIGRDAGMTEADVAQVFSCPVVIDAASGFRGKVSTRLYANNAHVLKLKSEFSLSGESAWKWCCSQLERERSYGIYPAHRYWAVLETAEGCAVANITRKGMTLEQALTDPAICKSTEYVTSLFSGFFHTYFSFWKQHQLRQDEGLSNYIVEAGRIYYVDDDIYRQDNLVSLAHSLCGYLRRLDYLDEESVSAISAVLKAEVSAIDRLLLTVLAEQLRDVFLPPQLAPLRHAMTEQLEQGATRKHVSCADRVALLADIHGNLPALKAVLADMESAGLKQAIVLGDIVGYGPFPAQCIDLLCTQPWIFVRGNHDHAAARGEPGGGFSRAARWSLPWTVQHLTRHQRDWLGSLPLLWRDGGLCAVHGSPLDPTFFNGYIYASTVERNLDAIQARDIHVCFHGHSHMRGIYFRDRGGLDRFCTDESVVLDDKSFYLVCPGSIGQPRNDSTKAQYAIYDRRARLIEFREIEYERSGLLAAMQAEDFPELIIGQFGFPAT